MPLYASIDLLVTLWAFRNIDLVQQGLYHIRIRLQSKIGKVHVIPVSHYNILPGGTPNDGYLQANISDDFTFCSRTFYIRYEEESVNLGDVCQFRIELDAERDMSEAVLLQVDLMHASRHSKGEVGDFALLCGRTLCISELDLGLHCSFPVIFEDMNFGLLDLNIHSMLFDYRHKPTSGMLHVEAASSKERQKEERERAKSRAISLSQPDSAIGFLVNNRHVLVDRLASSYHRLVRKMARLAKHSPSLTQDPVPVPPLEIPCLHQQQHQHQQLQADPAPPPSEPSARHQEAIGDLMPHEATLKDLNFIAGQTLELWTIFMHRVVPFTAEFFPHLHASWERHVCARWSESMFRETISLEDLSLPMYFSTQDMHMKVGEKLRASQHYQNMRPMHVEDLGLNTTSDAHPIVFEQTISSRDEFYTTTMARNRQAASGSGDFAGRHVFVMVHGFQGNSYDLRLLKNFIQCVNPDGIFLCSKANEADSVKQDIQTMGDRLAKEIDRFVQRENITVAKMSFVSHSMGSIITRACLTNPLMAKFLPRLHTFVSLSSPHLGYMYNKNKLLDGAMWVYKKWKKSPCLKQLSMSDGSMETCFMYRLSQARVLEYFQNIIILSSPQDRYVPIHSARIESCPEATKDGSKGRLFLQMVDNLLSPLKGHHVIRLNVMFSIAGRSLETFIGRTAHILFLDCAPFFRMLIYTYKRYFL